ncbi:MAG: RNA methyltransferase [Candidatus Omnitrophica bacterium]|nr:RNA methyltransferase [Candidatus Omnitrophota bacterium]
MKITSTANQKIKQVVKLRNRKARQETGLTVVEGVREVARAQEAGVPLPEVYICCSLYAEHDGQKHYDAVVQELKDKGSVVYEVNEKVFEKIAFGSRVEGILALVKVKQRKLSDLKTKKDPFFVVLENLEKPGNLGAILRTCDGAGVDGLIVSDTKTDIYNPNVIRASIGAVFAVPVVQSSPEEVLSFLKKHACRIVATTPQAENVYTQTDLKGPVAIVLGSEQEGLDAFWLDNAGLKVKIPMKGIADSLNVSVTTAVLVFEAIRQRNY